VIIFSTLCMGVFSLATTSAASVHQLMMWRFLTGIGLGGAMPNIIALTSEYSPQRLRATLITLMFCGFPLGAVLGGIASTGLIKAFGWQSVFLAGGLLPLVLVPILWRLLPESIRYYVAKGGATAKISALLSRISPGKAFSSADSYVLNEPRLAGMPVKHLFLEGRARTTLLLWIVFFSNLLILYFLINWLPSVLQAAGLSLERAIIGTVLLNAGGILGGLGLGWLVDRRGPFGVLFVSYCLAAMSILAIGNFASTVTFAMLIVFVAGFFVIGSQFCMNALAASTYPTSARSTGVGWALGIGRVGSVVGPVIGGWLLSLGWTNAALFFAVSVPAAVSAVAVALLGITRKPALPASVVGAETPGNQ
jgi:AAHS family 4-hydroxybenzoate transporter-like MFS transporter